jgi:MoxR-like ATPase
MTAFSYSIDKALRLPKQGSWPESFHVFDEDSVHALMAAEAAGRPLLVRGEPGTGKSQLARAAAVASKRLFLSTVVNARTECQDLQWHFDAVARLGEAQVLASVPDAERLSRLHPGRFLSPGPLWWAIDWDSATQQWNDCAHKPERAPEPPAGWTPERGVVLLIDEIDKAEADLPNSLLETLGNGDFDAPYQGGSVRRSERIPPPLLVITTNEERELPAAFLRRCLVLSLSLPEEEGALIEFLCARALVHEDAPKNAEVLRKAARMLAEDRRAALEQGWPAPGQAEYLDLLRAVKKMAADEAGQLKLLETIARFVLKKSPPVR